MEIIKKFLLMNDLVKLMEKSNGHFDKVVESGLTIHDFIKYANFMIETLGYDGHFEFELNKVLYYDHTFDNLHYQAPLISEIKSPQQKLSELFSTDIRWFKKCFTQYIKEFNEGIEDVEGFSIPITIDKK